MDSFESYLNNIENNIPNDRIDYYHKVVRPIYRELINRVNDNFIEIRDVISEKKVGNSQGQLITGFMSIYDYKNYHSSIGVEPIIKVNDNIEEAVENSDRTVNLKLRCKNGKYLFSFLYEGFYDEYCCTIDKKSEGTVVIMSSESNKKEISIEYRANMQYENKEMEVQQLFISNRPNESYFRIPICRRWIDVYSKDEIEDKEIINIIGLNINGKIGIPVWNIISHGKSNGSKKSFPDRKAISPYGLSGEKNQCVISFQRIPEYVSDVLVRVGKRKDLYMVTKYDKINRELKLYTNDNTIWDEKYELFYIRESAEIDVGKIEYVNYYSCLSEFHKVSVVQNSLTRASIFFFVNMFYDITKLKLEDMIVDGNKISVKMRSDKKNYMAKEYCEYIIELMNKLYVGYCFSGEVSYEK